MSGDQQVELKLSEPLEIAGIVQDDAGNPVPEGRVMLVGWDDSRILRRQAPIEVGGRFKLGGLPDGVLQIVAVDGRGAPVCQLPLYTRGGVSDITIKPEPSEADPMDYVVPPAAVSPTSPPPK